MIFLVDLMFPIQVEAVHCYANKHISNTSLSTHFTCAVLLRMLKTRSSIHWTKALSFIILHHPTALQKEES